MADTIILIVVLFLAAMVIIVAEICTPTFGLLGLGAVACAIAAVYYSFTLGTIPGFVSTIFAIVFLPAFTIIAVKKLPNTRFGRLLALKREQVPSGEGTPEASDLEKLVGRQATTQTTLRPSGTILIDARRIIAQAEAGMIDQGTKITIIRACGNYVVVRPVEEGKTM